MLGPLEVRRFGLDGATQLIELFLVHTLVNFDPQSSIEFSIDTILLHNFSIYDLLREFYLINRLAWRSSGCAVVFRQFAGGIGNISIGLDLRDFIVWINFIVVRLKLVSRWLFLQLNLRLNCSCRACLILSLCKLASLESRLD